MESHPIRLRSDSARPGAIPPKRQWQHGRNTVRKIGLALPHNGVDRGIEWIDTISKWRAEVCHGVLYVVQTVREHPPNHTGRVLAKPRMGRTCIPRYRL